VTHGHTAPDVADVTHIQAILQAIEDLTRFATRGCSATACDRVRMAWMGHQLQTIASHSERLSTQVRDSHPELPWPNLDKMTDYSPDTLGGLSADEMQRFVERDLPRFATALRRLNLT